MRRKKVFRVLGYVGFSGLALIFFFYVTFPAEAVGQRLASWVQQQTGGAVTLSFDDVDVYRLSGVRAEGVKIRLRGDKGDTTELAVDALRVRLRLLPLILLNLSASAGVDLGDGAIDAVVSKKGDDVELEIDLDDVDLSTPPLLQTITGLAVNGEMEGSVEGKIGLAAGRQKRNAGTKSHLAPERSEGNLVIRLKNGRLGPGVVSGFTIPAPIDLGQLEVTLDMRRGRAELTSFKQEGGQLAVDMSGSINLRRNFMASSLDSCLKIKFTDQGYLSKHSKIKTALQLAEVRFKKDTQGFLNIKYIGTLAHPQPQSGYCRAGGQQPKRSRK